MKPAEKIERLIKKSRYKASPEAYDKALGSFLQEVDDYEKQKSALTGPNIWRIIMKSRITKLAAAAVIIIAVGLFLAVMEKATTPAYALEQTLEAMQDVRTLHMFGRDWGNLEFEMWIKLNPETGIPDYCYMYHPQIKCLAISTPKLSYQYNERANRVLVNSGKLFNINVAPARLFEDLLQSSQMENSNIDIKIYHEPDPETGKSLIVVISESPNETWKGFVDPETKLPVRLYCLKKNNRLGSIFKDIDRIEYNVDLPEKIFEFEIPDGAKIVDMDKEREILSDPQYGISTEGLTEQQAAEEIVTQYWDAMINMDLTAAQKLYPSLDMNKARDSMPIEHVENGKLYIEPGCGIGKVIPCIIRYEDGSLKEWKLIIKQRNIDGLPSCVIAGFYNSPVEIE
ncbi:MAG: LolA family protein [Planctomycetota bacterium]|jgi:hypothetical protein